MILQKSFYNLLFKNNFLLLSMMKTAVLLNILEESVICESIYIFVIL